MEGAPWRTSRFLSKSPTNPTLHPWTAPPTSHPSFRGHFSHIFLGSKIYLLYL